MAKKKNLSKDDVEDVNQWLDRKQKTTGTNKIQINDIPIKIKCENEKQKKLKKSIENNEITICVGPAGTGKTYLSLITALHILKTSPQYRRIILIKSLQTIQGEETGFLPGTLQEKMEPYMTSYTGNLNKIFGDRGVTKALIADGTIGVEPIAFIRGNTLDNSIIIIDETQNIDMHTFKTIITRIGRNSKMIFIGDTEQIDRKAKNTSCLQKVHSGFEPHDFVGTVEFVNEECVRNKIIPKVLEVLNTLE